MRANTKCRAIADIFTAGTDEFRFHALLYPALAAKGNHDNVVIFPEIVDSHLELVRAVYFRISGVDPDIPRYYAQELATAERFEQLVAASPVRKNSRE